MQAPSEALRLGLRDLSPKQGIEDFKAQAPSWLSLWCEQEAVRPFQGAKLRVVVQGALIPESSHSPVLQSEKGPVALSLEILTLPSKQTQQHL